MPRTRPATTGYERLAQADQLSDDSDDEFLGESSASLQPASAPRFAPITQPLHRSGMTSPRAPGSRPKFRRRVGSAGGVDIKAINARLERWADEIASKFKRGRSKSTAGEDERLEIQHSVFRPPDGVRPITPEGLAEPQPGVMTVTEFDAIVESVRLAIREEVHPSMISQGSSGSYFARNPDGKIVGVFKPKDEEPYAAGNPKWNKWIHRNLFPCFFGRACLIPNLSYVSEAAAYILDTQLRTHLVPYTDIVWLSSKSFHYPYWDRRSFYRKKKPLPAKPGSFQVFLKGFKDANVFLRENPWPDQYWAGFRTNDTSRRKKTKWSDNCRPSNSTPVPEEDSSDEEQEPQQSAPDEPAKFAWTDQLKQAFREELEKLVILDYIMRNTDRGLDNWMVKVDWEAGTVSLASEPMHLNMDTEPTESDSDRPRPVDASDMPATPTRASHPYRRQKPMDASKQKNAGKQPEMSLGAIDNSLSWPWKHPDAWRSFPFGWLFLPVDLIGRPFSQKTRDHFLPLLTSTAWWAQTQMALKRVFQIDEDFQERMFAKQIAVMKGQAWNVVEALKSADHGPLELTRRAKVCVWDDLVEVPVAVPMRVTSSEMRRQAAQRASMDEEEDIASSAPANNSAHVADLLGFSTGPGSGGGGSAPVDMPNPNRFEISSPKSEAARSPDESALTGSDILTLSNDKPPQQQQQQHQTDSQHARRNSTSNTNAAAAAAASSHLASTYHGPSRALNAYDPPRNHMRSQSYQQRRYSFATAASRRNSSSIAQHLYGGDQQHAGHRGPYDYYEGGDDDLEGDLGYAAAEGQMGHRRKVIVERLEAVKSSNPVFTWC